MQQVSRRHVGQWYGCDCGCQLHSHAFHRHQRIQCLTSCIHTCQSFHNGITTCEKVSRHQRIVLAKTFQKPSRELNYRWTLNRRTLCVAIPIRNKRDKTSVKRIVDVGTTRSYVHHILIDDVVTPFVNATQPDLIVVLCQVVFASFVQRLESSLGHELQDRDEPLPGFRRVKAASSGRCARSADHL